MIPSLWISSTACSNPRWSALSAPKCLSLLTLSATSHCHCPWRKIAPWRCYWSAMTFSPDPCKYESIASFLLQPGFIFKLINLIASHAAKTACIWITFNIIALNLNLQFYLQYCASDSLLVILLTWIGGIKLIPSWSALFILRLSQFRVVVPKLGTVADLCSALAKLSGVPAENVRLEKHILFLLNFILSFLPSVAVCM